MLCCSTACVSLASNSVYILDHRANIWPTAQILMHWQEKVILPRLDNLEIDSIIAIFKYNDTFQKKKKISKVFLSPQFSL